MGTSYGRNHNKPPFSFWPALGQTEDVQMLLRFGADPTLLDRQSRSVVDVLKRNKNFKAIEKINSHLEKLATCSKDLSGTASSVLTFGGDKTGSVTLDTNPFISFRYIYGSETYQSLENLFAFFFFKGRMRQLLFREML